MSVNSQLLVFRLCRLINIETAVKADSEVLVAALQTYHREQLSNNRKISERLLADHGIKMRCVYGYTLLPHNRTDCKLSAATVKRRRKELGLTGSGVTTRTMARQDIEQLVLNQLAQDPTNRLGIRTIQHQIAHSKGIHLTRFALHSLELHTSTEALPVRDVVSEIMHMHAPDGFALRDPKVRKLHKAQDPSLAFVNEMANSLLSASSCKSHLIDSLSK
jgi:hypothetical protein